MENTYTVGKLADNLKINKETIRYYEKIGLLSSPKKDKNGYRLYTEEDMQKIKFIIVGKHFGFSLRELNYIISNKMLCGNIENTKKLVNNKLNDINQKLSELEKTKKILEKINKTISSQDIVSCSSIDNFFEDIL